MKQPFCCPVCQGRQQVHYLFYEPSWGPLHTASTSSEVLTVPCRSCAGAGVLWGEALHGALDRATAPEAPSPVVGTRGSGNVYRDLGIPDADAKQRRVQWFVRLQHALQQSGLPNAALAQQLGISPRRVRRLLTGHLDDFTTEEILRHLRTVEAADADHH